MDSRQAVQALAALAHDRRLALFRMLVERGPDGLSAGIIAERLGVAPSSLTFHVQHLHRAGPTVLRHVPNPRGTSSSYGLAPLHSILFAGGKVPRLIFAAESTASYLRMRGSD